MSQFEGETVQDRYKAYASQAAVTLDDLDENTKFLFYRDDPFQRMLKRTNQWIDFLGRGFLIIRHLSR